MLSKFISFEEMKHKTYSYWAASAVIVLINIYLKRTRGPSSAAKCGSGAPFSIRIRAPLPFETLRGKRLPSGRRPCRVLDHIVYRRYRGTLQTVAAVRFGKGRPQPIPVRRRHAIRWT